MSKFRFHLPEGERHILLVDERGIILGEVWDYKLRASIESGETDPTSRTLIDAFVDLFQSTPTNYVAPLRVRIKINGEIITDCWTADLVRFDDLFQDVRVLTPFGDEVPLQEWLYRVTEPRWISVQDSQGHKWQVERRNLSEFLSCDPHARIIPELSGN